VRDVNPSYVRGAHGLIFVVDGTRRDTFDQGLEIRDAITNQIGSIPAVFAFNKADLTEEWLLTTADEDSVTAGGLHAVRTSAKTGEGVEATFKWLAEAAHQTPGA
jgi:signal recognition particle receptor subunit beta